MELLIGCLNTFPLEMGGQMGKSTYAMGGGEIVASVHVCTIGEGGVKFLPFWCVCNN